MCPRPLAKFRFYLPDSHYFYATVIVAKSSKDLIALYHSHTKRHGMKRIGTSYRTAALTIGCYLRDRHRRLTGEVAKVFLRRGQLHSRIVAHEFSHVACRWAVRTRTTILRPKAGAKRCTPGEEKFCYIVGDLTQAFFFKVNKLDLFSA